MLLSAAYPQYNLRSVLTVVPDNTVVVGINIVVDNNFKLQHVPLPLFLLDRPDVLGGASNSGSRESNLRMR